MGLKGFPGVRQDIVLIRGFGTADESRTPLGDASVQGTHASLPLDAGVEDGDVLEVPSSAGSPHLYELSDIQVYEAGGNLDHIAAKATRLSRPKSKPSAGRQVFVSHATADSEVVQDFVRLLETGVGIAQADIFCTSMPGSGVVAGEDFVARIRREAGANTCMLAVISPAFMESKFCWSELGAAWVQAKLLIPVLYSAVPFADLNSTVIRGLQALRLGEPSGLDGLRDRLVEAMGLTSGKTSRWSADRDHFLKLHAEAVGAKPQDPAPSNEALPDELDDPTLIELLRNKLPRKAGFFLFAQLDSDVGVPAGTSKRLAAKAATAEGRYDGVTAHGIRLSGWTPFTVS